MLQIFVGFIVLLAVMMVAHWFATTPPVTVIRTAKWTGAALVVGGGVLLVATGRIGWALAAVAGLVPWVVRLVDMHSLYRTLRLNFHRMSGGRRGAGRNSRVETRFLSMTLDHDSGALSGEVMEGPFRGRKLSQLSFDEAVELYRQCAADSQSVQVLEAWLDRTWPDWRERPSAGQPRTGGGAMTRDEAYEVLGLSQGASPAEIKAAHRRLMGQLHPDHGGSNYLAAKINQAKDILLRD